MPSFILSRLGRWITVPGLILAIVTSAAPALAEGGNVLPPTARPKGYSLADMAAATAVFNAGGPDSRSPATEPDVPFQILYTSTANPTGTFTVRPGTMLYVPVVFTDNSPPILGDFPADLTDRAAVANYFFNQQELGAVSIQVVVDGQVTDVGPNYVVGVNTAPLPDGGGTGYIVAGVFLTPLATGAHTVEIRALFTGAALDGFFPGGVFQFADTFTVIVR